MRRRNQINLQNSPRNWFVSRLTSSLRWVPQRSRLPRRNGDDSGRHVRGDPIRSGLVASLARPGGNVTGLSNFSPDLAGKRLELLKEIVPRVSRIAVLWNPESQLTAFKETQAAAGTLGVELQSVEVKSANDIESAFRAAAKGQAGAVTAMLSASMFSQRTRTAEIAAKYKLPTMYSQSLWVEAGGLMSYGTHFPDLWRRAATYVDKILKGAKPADLPVEQPTKFEFIVNLKAAKEIGLTIPPNVLARADRVIKESAGINR